MSTYNFVLKELSECIGICSAELYKIIEKHCAPIERKSDFAILENYGFLLAHLHHEDGISADEAHELAAMISAEGGQQYFDFLNRAMNFYSNIFFQTNKNNAFLQDSIICYNLIHFGTWNDFENELPLMDALIVTQTSLEIKNFLKKELPQMVNPILERL